MPLRIHAVSPCDLTPLFCLLAFCLLLPSPPPPQLFGYNEWLVRWLHWPPMFDRWEDASHLALYTDRKPQHMLNEYRQRQAQEKKQREEEKEKDKEKDKEQETNKEEEKKKEEEKETEKETEKVKVKEEAAAATEESKQPS